MTAILLLHIPVGEVTGERESSVSWQEKQEGKWKWSNALVSEPLRVSVWGSQGERFSRRGLFRKTTPRRTRKRIRRSYQNRIISPPKLTNAYGSLPCPGAGQ
jgi:hypothetical protein